mmetsp:Transcript_9377/g.21905  ORF Transcript_9377/g.21905 Transcript_9377/m.21905 type:complete len:207 (+) Transcript_9377:356-976(+)
MGVQTTATTHTSSSTASTPTGACAIQTARLRWASTTPTSPTSTSPTPGSRRSACASPPAPAIGASQRTFRPPWAHTGAGGARAMWPASRSPSSSCRGQRGTCSPTTACLTTASSPAPTGQTAGTPHTPPRSSCTSVCLCSPPTCRRSRARPSPRWACRSTPPRSGGPWPSCPTRRGRSAPSPPSLRSLGPSSWLLLSSPSCWASSG